MKLFVTLHIVLLVPISVSASSFTVALSRVQSKGASKGIAHADQARATYLKSLTDGGSNTPNIPLTNFKYQAFSAQVGIGNPPTYYKLVVDTGSSNTFCGIGAPYVRTPTSIPTGKAVGVYYGSGSFTGMEYLDQVTIAPGIVIRNQSIGDALNVSGFAGFNGFIGFGPVDVTKGTLPSGPNVTIPTVMNNLVSQGLIKNQVLGVYFAPRTNVTDANGILTVGGVDSSLYKGDITYFPMTKTKPAASFWGINVTSCTYGNQSIIPTSTAGIVDTGTTQLLLANDFFDKYMKAIPGAKLDNITGFLEIPHSSVKDMQPLTFFIGGKEFILDVSAQLVPTYENEGWGGIAGKQYAIVGNLGSLFGSGLEFILGVKFMERYYAVFDTDKNRVGLALTNHTFSQHKNHYSSE